MSTVQVYKRATMRASLRILTSVSRFCWYQRSWIGHASFVVSQQASIDSFLCLVHQYGSTLNEAHLHRATWRASLPPLSMLLRNSTERRTQVDEHPDCDLIPAIVATNVASN